MASSKTRRRSPSPPAKAPTAVLQDEVVDALGRLPYVTRVLWDDTDCDLVVFIVIDAPPFDGNFRVPIHMIELDLIRRHPELTFRFRLVNPAEYGPEGIETSLPADACTLLSR